jgi:hypothetical protein
MLSGVIISTYLQKRSTSATPFDKYPEKEITSTYIHKRSRMHHPL